MEFKLFVRRNESNFIANESITLNAATQRNKVRLHTQILLDQFEWIEGQQHTSKFHLIFNQFNEAYIIFRPPQNISATAIRMG